MVAGLASELDSEAFRSGDRQCARACSLDSCPRWAASPWGRAGRRWPSCVNSPSACSAVSRNEVRSFSSSRICIGPTARPARCSRCWREPARSGGPCSSARIDPTRSTAAIRCVRCWPRSRGVRPERFDLEPLDRAGTAEVIAAIGSSVVVDRALVNDIYRLSAGNPFFIEELVAARHGQCRASPRHCATSSSRGPRRWTTQRPKSSGSRRRPDSTIPAVLAEVSGVDAVSLATTIDVLVAAALLVP